MTVSIVIPNYNGAKHIDQCIRSCVSQSYSDIEIIFVDDASTDDSINVVSRISDKRLKVIRREKNGGTAAARNTGIAATSGEFVAFLDSDDMLTVDSVSRRVKMFVFPWVGIVSGGSYLVDGDKGVKHFYRNHDQLRKRYGTYVHSPTGMIRSWLLEMHGGFDERCLLSEDREFWATMLLVHKIPMIKLVEPVAYYRRHSTNKLRNATEEERAAETKLIEGILKDKGVEDSSIEPMEAGFIFNYDSLRDK